MLDVGYFFAFALSLASVNALSTKIFLGTTTQRFKTHLIVYSFGKSVLLCSDIKSRIWR